MRYLPTCHRHLLLLTLLSFTLGTLAQPMERKAEKANESGVAFGLIKEMFESCSQVNTMACEVQKKERYAGNYVEAHSRIKMSNQPYSIYLKQLDSEKGIELLYSKGFNGGKVLVNPNGFPWINISLDPYSSLIRNNQHHLISDIGFSKFNRVLAHLLKKYEHIAHDLAEYKGEETIDDHRCHVVEINNRQYKLMTYTTVEGETTMSVADKFHISEYRIVELNESISGFGSLSSGMTITIPNDYAPYIKLFIDQERLIPMRFEVYDDNGALFEAYEYSKVQLNTRFDEKELTAEFPEYGF